MQNNRGISYKTRVKQVVEIYDKFARSGLSNREIWRRHIYPKFYICEKTLYSYLKQPIEELKEELKG